MSDYPFDLDLIIRRAGLRRQGINGLASLVVAMREEGFLADMLVRPARMEALARVDGAVRYVKEQDQYVFRAAGRMTNLYLDTDWQQVLERFHRYVKGANYSLDTFKSYFMKPADVMTDEKVMKYASPAVVDQVRQLIQANQSPKPLGRPYRPWRPTKGTQDTTHHSVAEPVGIRYLDPGALADLLKHETNRGTSLETTAHGSAEIVRKAAGLETHVMARQILGLGTYDNPQVIEGYRCAIQTPATQSLLVFGEEGSWGGLTTVERNNLGQGIRSFIGPEQTLGKLPHPVLEPTEKRPWVVAIRQHALLQLASHHSTHDLELTPYRHKI